MGKTGHSGDRNAASARPSHCLTALVGQQLGAVLEAFAVGGRKGRTRSWAAGQEPRPRHPLRRAGAGDIPTARGSFPTVNGSTTVRMYTSGHG